MISFIKNNKLFSFMIFFSILIFFIGIICSSILDDESKKLIINNISNLVSNIKDKNVATGNNFFRCLSNSLVFCSIIWVFGISIIGLPIVLFLYSTKLFLFSIEFMYLFINIKNTGLIFNIIYLLSDTLNIAILFLITYYSISYSVVLFRFLFRKRNYPLQKITKKYCKIFVLSIVMFLISSIIEIFVIPRVLVYLI